VDLNGDGHKDILSGSYSRMDKSMAGLFQVLWGRPDRTFSKAETLNGADGAPLIIPTKGEDDVIEAICTRPFAVDWDGDGHLDLVVGNFAGSFYLFAGQAGGKFNPTPRKLMAGDEPLKINGIHGDPFVVDWDGDGDLDIISGSSKGGVEWAENLAGRGKPPRLAKFRTLIPAPELQNDYRENEVVAPAGATRVWVADFNSDGKLDLLVGDNVAIVSPAEGVSEADFARRRAAWTETYAALTREAADATDQEKQSAIYERMNKLYAERSEFMSEDRTGFVWLYLRK
jgi:hypothetical protein